MHEAALFDENCFITLTYSDAFLPYGRTLVKSDFQLFMKRFREHLARKSAGRKVRFYYCGEYGERFGRPHFHALIFNYDFPDKYRWRVTGNGDNLYRSDFLESLWTVGNSEIGSVTFDSAAYVARYCMKKRTGSGAREWYEYVDEDGVCHDRLPEFTDMSRRPGIGAGWLERFGDVVYRDDSVVINEREVKPPRFYDNRYELVNAGVIARVKRERKRESLRFRKHATRDRLRVRAKIALARLKLYKRELE